MMKLIRTSDTHYQPNDGKHEFATYAVEEAVVDHLRPDGDGIIDQTADQSRKCTEMLGKLVAMLDGKGVLSDDNVLDLLNYCYEKSRFRPEDTR